MKIQAVSLLVLAVFSAVSAAAAPEGTLIASYGTESSSARIEPAQMAGKPGVAVVFEGTEDMHYYATETAAPAPGMELQVEASAADVTFGPAVYPPYQYFDDPSKGKIEVWAGDFAVFVPVAGAQASGNAQVTVTIRGMACTSRICLPPFEEKLTATVDWSQTGQNTLDFEPSSRSGATAEQQTETKTESPQADQEAEAAGQALADRLAGWSETGQGEMASTAGAGWYLLLAVLAGLSINIMPCVLPVLPLIILRLSGQAKESAARRVGLGLAFCGGIVLFFAMFAVISASVKAATGTALELNSLYRSPTAVTVMFLLIVLFALAMLDVVPIRLPGFTGGKGRSGYLGSVGTGFGAGVLSTPCSGAVIGAVLVWSQTQTVWVSGLAMVLMGVGMALPYAVLVAVPKLLNLVPKPGTWMEIFKKTGGFLLLAIAFKFMLAGLAKEHLLSVLLYGVVFAFCAWMWGSWVDFNTPAKKRRTVRAIAIVIAIAAGFWMLPEPEEPKIDWQAYDAQAIEQAIERGRPVLVKFTADWCTNCKVVERRVYQDPEAVEMIKQRNFLTVKADTTQADYPASVDMRQVFGEAGNVPVTILLDPKDRSITKLRGIFTVDELQKTLTADPSSPKL